MVGLMDLPLVVVMAAKLVGLKVEPKAAELVVPMVFSRVVHWAETTDEMLVVTMVAASVVLLVSMLVLHLVVLLAEMMVF